MTILEAELGSPQIIELVASCLSFPTRLISLESKFYNSRYSLKSKERSNSYSFFKNETVTVGQEKSMCLLMSNFNYLRGRHGSS